MNHVLAFPAEAGPHFTGPEGMEGWVDLVGLVTDCLPVRLSEDGHLSSEY